MTAWNDRQAMRMPMLFSPTIGAAIVAGYWFLRARCPACRHIKIPQSVKMIAALIFATSTECKSVRPFRETLRRDAVG